MEALDQLKQVFDDGVATINERDYSFTVMTHSERVKVFSYFSAIQSMIQHGNFEFLDDAKYKEVEKTISGRVTFDGMQLSKLPKHFEEYPEDYLMFVTTALGVISYPFLKSVSRGK